MSEVRARRSSGLPPGTWVRDRYVLGEALGRGGTSTVYAALDASRDVEVAVKVLDAEMLGKDRERMLREAKITAGLGHPGIVRVLDGGLLDAGRAFLVMERLRGRTLADRLDGCFWLPLDEAIAVAGQLLEALEAAHAASVLHRDVKPSNVFVSDEPLLAKLIDFGIGVDLGDPRSRVTEPDVVVGTLGYLAPEQLFGDDASVRSDLYAAGATIYEMLTGRPPFPVTDGDMRTLLRAMTKTAPPIRELRPSVPEALSEGVTRALSRRASDRHASAIEMRAACGLDALAA
jgi:serine/threonine protein kinase